MSTYIDWHTEMRIRYGNVKRARGFYLYTEKNIRLLDMYADGGAAFFGRRIGNIHLAVKQYLDKGLTGNIPTTAERQLRKAAAKLFPDHSVLRLYGSEHTAYECCVQGLAEPQTPLAQVVWRPALPNQADRDIMLVRPPFFTGCTLVVARPAYERVLPPSDPVMPPLLYALAKTLFFVIRMLPEERAFWDIDAVSTVPVLTAKKKKLLSAGKEKQTLQVLLAKYWTVRGRYLFARLDERAYLDFFAAALDAHILISPVFDEPSILPRIDSYAELRHFLQVYEGV